MKFKRSLAVRLVLAVFGIMGLANLLTGAAYLYVSSKTGHVPMQLSALVRSPFHLLIISLFLGLLLTAMFSRILLKPLNQLIAATKKVAKGDFSVRVEQAQAKDEMAELVGSFNHMAEELGNSELFKKDFINSFSHEFRTPIVSIRGFAKQLRRADLTEAQRREYVEIIVSESERLSHMASNILLLTRLENQRILTDLSEYWLDEQLRGAILLLEKQWSDKALALDLALSPVRVRASEEMLSHVWINILENAVKFSAQGGKLRVACARDGEMARVTIADEGVGMDAEVVRRIFDKFYQGEADGTARTSRAVEGNGLGLPLAKRIVELSGGTIEVASEPGGGAAFTIELPAH
ncbi:MAG: HAMP domain-containing sensor histidine kinase [Christensenellales bacterium]|jgi:signal transduction histidine kinase